LIPFGSGLTREVFQSIIPPRVHLPERLFPALARIPGGANDQAIVFYYEFRLIREVTLVEDGLRDPGTTGISDPDDATFMGSSPL